MSSKEVKSSKGMQKKGADAENVVRYSIYGVSGVIAVCLLLIVVFLIIPNTVATAGDQKITQDEFVFFHTQVINSYMQYNTEGQDFESFLNQDMGNGMTIKQISIATATQQVHDYAVQYDLAKKNGLTLATDEINAVATNLRSALEQAANENKVSLNTISKANFGLNFNKVMKIYEKMMLGDKYAEQQLKEASFTDEEYKEYYEENKESIDRVKVRHILLTFDAENDSEVKIKGIEDKANDLLEKIKDGEDFEKLVEEFSEDAGSNEKGGEYTFARGEMVKEFEEYSFDNEPGSMAVVKTEYGYHIVEVLDHLFGYEANQETIKNRLPGIRYKEKITELKEDEYAMKFRASFSKMFER